MQASRAGINTASSRSGSSRVVALREIVVSVVRRARNTVVAILSVEPLHERVTLLPLVFLDHGPRLHLMKRQPTYGEALTGPLHHGKRARVLAHAPVA